MLFTRLCVDITLDYYIREVITFYWQIFEKDNLFHLVV